MNKINISDVQANILARSIYKEIQSFYSDPENVRKFEEWKKQQDKNKKSNC